MFSRTPVVQRDTVIHVAQFLQEPIGATRQVRITLERLPLDDDLVASQIAANLRLTRIPTGIVVKGPVAAVVSLECTRCLEAFDQTIQTEIADEYRPTVDVTTGIELPVADPDEGDDDFFTISGLHLLDVGESLRQALVLILPMAPVCREDCPGLPEAAELMSEGDARLAILEQLLGQGQSDESGDSGARSTRNRNRAKQRTRSR